jgi:penicillin-binding protein 1A
VLAIVAASLVGIVGAVAVVGMVVIQGYIADAPQMPSREALWTLRRSPGMTFLDRDGQVIATRGAKYGQPVTLAALPAFVPKAFLAAEDRRFYQHGPVDLHAIARAAEANFRAHRSVEGASTLTQQLARTLFLKRDPSLKRKIQEAWLAWRLEQAMSKDEILELYLNRTYFGAGAYGLDAASRTYFGKPAAQLDLAEAATLAGLPNAPSRLALTNDLPAAIARGHKILETMREEGWITPTALAAALAGPPQLAPASNNEGDMSYVLDQAAAEAAQLTGGQTPDLVISTTVDPVLQATGVAAVRDVVLKEGARRNVSQGALVSLAPDGAILAMVGGLDHDKSSFNRVVQARRQPGSSFKAFVYGAAVEHGDLPGDIRDDAPISFGNWSPENYGKSYAGPVTLRQALARSLNTVSVRLTLEVGPQAVAAFARRLGLADIPADPGPSIALGAYEVSPLELAAGYQVFQTGGGKTTPYLVSEVRSTRGDVLWAHAASAATPVLDPLFATRMIDMLKAVITSGTGVGANIGRPVAGKTGTSQNWRDAWFVGFTPDILTAVWVGNDDGASMAKVTGGELPVEIWRRYMTVAEKTLPPRDFPWLVPEPPAPPSEDTGAGTYQDEPPMDGQGADDGDNAAAPDDADQPPGAGDAGQTPDAGDRYGPPGGDGRGDSGEDRYPPPREDYGPPAADEPPPPDEDRPPPRQRGDDRPDSSADAEPRYRY